MHKVAFVPAVLVVVAGCSVLPSFDHPLGPSDVSPTVTEVVDHIQCEILAAKNDPDPVFRRLTDYQYVVFASMTLDVTNSQGFTPVFDFIRPYSVSGTSLSASVAPEVTGLQHRQMNQTFTLAVFEPGEGGVNRCPNSHYEAGLKGNLGLKEVIAAGLAHVADTDFVFGLPGKDSAAGTAAASINANLSPIFGSIIDFTVVYGLANGGPVWTLTNFTGPGANTLALNRTTKDTLTISFAPAGLKVGPGQNVPGSPGPSGAVAPSLAGPVPSPAANAARVEAAGLAAQNNVTRLLLQNLLRIP